MTVKIEEFPSGDLGWLHSGVQASILHIWYPYTLLIFYLGCYLYSSLE